MMSRFLIHAANYAWLVVVLAGVPAITRVRLGGLNVSSTSKFEMLTLGGLALGLAINLFAGCWLGGKQRASCWKWAIAQGMIFLTFHLVFNEQIHFGWLKQFLLWVKGAFAQS